MGFSTLKVQENLVSQGKIHTITDDEFEDPSAQPFICTVLNIRYEKGGNKKPWKKWLDCVGQNMKANTDIIPKQSIIFGFKLW